jgi:hypothetical protein
MALETKYVVGRTESTLENDLTRIPYPVVYRVIEVDGVEVSRGTPDFKEVAAASPETVPLYFDEVRNYFIELSQWFDEQSAFTADTFRRFLALRRFVNSYTSNFDVSMQGDEGFGPGDQRA